MLHRKFHRFSLGSFVIKKSNVLHSAAESNSFELVKYLVDKKVDINRRTHSGQTPIMVACANGNLEIVEYLYEKGANIITIGRVNYSLILFYF